MRATTELPVAYRHYASLNFSTIRAAILLNLAAVPLLFPFGYLLSQAIILLRSVTYSSGDNGDLYPGFFDHNLIILLGSILLITILHELIHGFFFWFYTRTRPQYRLKSGYAFAAAPEWYIPRRSYIAVGLSPLVLISVFSILLAWLLPASIGSYVWLAATFNAAGSLGDMLVAAWVLRQPGGCMVKDEGDKFHSYVPSFQ